MKFFMDAAARVALEREEYIIEFQLPNAAEEFWDSKSLYITEEALIETGFSDFWSDRVDDGTVFDMDTILIEDLIKMLELAKTQGGTVLEMINELYAWAQSNLLEPKQRINVNWEFHRALARREAERQAYQCNPEFLKEMEALRGLPMEVQLEEEKHLLRKYNMPKCFFSMDISNPEEW